MNTRKIFLFTEVFPLLYLEFGIEVHRNKWLDRLIDVHKKNGEIISISTLSKKKF
jgi:hypothetical protein